MFRVVSPAQAGLSGGEYYWLRVTSYSAGATLQFDQQQVVTLDALVAYEAPLNKPWKEIALTGTVVIEVNSDPNEKFPGPVNQSSGAIPIAQSASGPGQIALSATVVPVSDLGGVSNPALYDVTSAVNTALDTGILDVSLWRSLFYYMLTTLATTFSFAFVDDGGSSLQVIFGNSGAGVGQAGGWGLGTSAAADGANIPATFSVPLPLPRRVRFTAGAVAASTTRLRIEGRR